MFKDDAKRRQLKRYYNDEEKGNCRWMDAEIVKRGTVSIKDISNCTCGIWIMDIQNPIIIKKINLGLTFKKKSYYGI